MISLYKSLKRYHQENKRSADACKWEFPKIGVHIRVPLRGYYKGTIRVPLNKGLEFPEIRGTAFWGPYNKDATI